MSAYTITAGSASGQTAAPASVVAALTQVMREVQGVAKKDRNQAQGFNFRGIDAVMNAVGPALRTHGVVVVPQVRQYDYSTVEVGKNRTSMGHVRLTVAYVFYGPDGDSITAVSVGEAMDSGDKATAKAMSVAFRTALLQALCLPTDEQDPDHDVYERSPSGIPDEAYADAVVRLEGAGSVDELKEMAAAVGRLDLSAEQRQSLRDVYTRQRDVIGQSE